MIVASFLTELIIIRGMRYIGLLIYYSIYGIPVLIIWCFLFPIIAIDFFVDLIIHRKYYSYKFGSLFAKFSIVSLVNKWVLFTYILTAILLSVIYLTTHNTFGIIHYSNYSIIVEKFLQINSVLVGVVISILLLTFRVLNENYGTFAFRAIFKSFHNRVLISLFLFNFFLSTYAISYWNQNTQDFYFNLLFWITFASNLVLICVTFPLAFSSLRFASEDSNIDAILKALDDKWISDHQYNSFTYSANLANLDSDPIKEITRTSRRSIETEDFDSFQMINRKFYLHLAQIANRNQGNLKFAYRTYCEFINTLFPISLRSESINFTRHLSESRVNLEISMLKLKIPKEHNPVWRRSLNDFQIDYSPFFYKTTSMYDEAYFDTVITAYYRLGEFYIREILPKELPFYDKFGHENMSLKMFISYLLGNGITKISERLSEEQHSRHFQYLSKIFTLQHTVIQSNNSRSTKIFLVHILELAKRNSFEYYLKSNPTRVGYLSYPFTLSFVFDHELKELNRTQTLSGLLWSCDLAQQYGKLNNLILNQLKAAVLGLYRLKTEEGIDIGTPLSMCIEQFDKLRSNLSTTSDLHDMDMYLALYSYLKLVHSEALKASFLDRKLKTKFNAIIKKFDKKDSFQKTLESSYYIRDESIT